VEYMHVEADKRDYINLETMISIVDSAVELMKERYA
jgi:hypothetical protein